jgi:glycine/D-amino acid oxidase-like deaminating enzyme/nitrite reductase/ring-hydroxylating ferredoxin subunit
MDVKREGFTAMDKETVPFWTKAQKQKNYPPLKQDILCDVCVIGAGIAGLTTAYLLSKEGKKVVVLDDGLVAGGQTMRTTAHLSNALDDRYITLEKYFGRDGAKLAAESHQAAIYLADSIVKEYAIDCDFEMTEAYLFNPPNGSPKLLNDELEAAKRAGVQVKMVERCPFPDFDTEQAICFLNQAQFHPLKFIDKLCEIIENLGGQIFCSSHVTEIAEKYRIHTNQNYHVDALHTVMATNSPIHNKFFPHLKQAAYRTYVIAGKIPKNYLPTGLYYDTIDPYHFVRIFKENDHDVLIVGGEDHRTAEAHHLGQRFDRLESWTRHHFPSFQQVTYRWSGQVLEPIDSLGFIGRSSHELYFITGDSGSGITHGLLGGILINDLIHQRESPWEKLYNPHRITWHASYDFVEENLDTAWQYTDWFTSGDDTPLKPHCGKVIREGLTKCALYKDEKGHTHKMSAVCPHLKALVRWNEEEHCWECPAHGSRFNALGEVIQGPANSNLKKLGS